jgi:serine/threonine-protein kinase RsbW
MALMKQIRSFKRNFNELENIFTFTGSFFSEYGIGEDHRFGVELSVEEIFTNMVKYNTSAPDDIGIEFECDETSLFIRFTDHEDRPFDVTAGSPVDLKAYHEAGKTGGLGLHLVRQFMDDILYEVNGNMTTITLIKKLSQ